MAISVCLLKWYPVWITFLQVHVHRWGLINLNSNGGSQKSHDFKSPVFPRGVCYSCTGSFLGMIKIFFIPFKTFVRRCFISWRSTSCLAAALVFENRNYISVESTWAGYSSSFSKVVSKFRKVSGRLLGWHWFTDTLHLRAYHFPLSRLVYQPRVPEEGWEESTGWFGVWQSGEVGGWGEAPEGHGGWWSCSVASQPSHWISLKEAAAALLPFATCDCGEQPS